MKRLLNSIAVIAAVLTISACSQDSTTETTPTSYCYISSFTLGTIKRTVEQNGTTTQTTYAGSSYPMSIDQRLCEITNTKSLLMGTDLSSVPVTVTAQGSVVFAPENDQSAWYAYTTAGGTVDFRTPVLFRTYATDGSGFKEYKVTLTVRDTEVGSYTWSAIETDVLANRQERKAVTWKEKLTLLSADNTGALHTVTYDGSEWSTDVTCTGTTGAALATLQSYDDQLWMSTSDGTLLKSSDGQNWDALVQTDLANKITLIAATSEGLYARIHNESETYDWLARSKDGSNWTTLPMESATSISAFPTTSTYVSYKQDNQVQCLIVAGTTASGTTAVWRLNEQETSPEWMLITNDNEDTRLNWSTGMTIVRDNDALIALSGGDATCYTSLDNGLVWKKHAYLETPIQNTLFAAATFKGCIYIFAGSSVQRAVINS